MTASGSATPEDEAVRDVARPAFPISWGDPTVGAESGSGLTGFGSPAAEFPWGDVAGMDPATLLRLAELGVFAHAPAASTDPDAAADADDDEGDASVVRVPSFIERLRAVADAGFDLEDPGVELLIPAREAIAFALGHRLEWEDARRILSGETTYAERVRAGWLQRIRQFLDGLVPHRETRVPEPIWAPVAEIHCPHRDGCRASYTRVSESERKVGLDVTIRGIKAGGGLAQKLRLEQTLHTEHGCRRAVVAVLVETQRWTHDAFPDFALEIIDVKELAGTLGAEDIPDAVAHLCGPHYERAAAMYETGLRQGWESDRDVRWHPLSATRSTGEVEGRREVSRDRSFHFETAGVEVESRFTRGVRSEYSFSDQGVAGYFGFHPDPRSESFFWCW